MIDPRAMVLFSGLVSIIISPDFLLNALRPWIESLFGADLIRRQNLSINCNLPGRPTLRGIAAQESAHVDLELMRCLCRCAEDAAREFSFNLSDPWGQRMLANQRPTVSVLVKVPCDRSPMIGGGQPNNLASSSTVKRLDAKNSASSGLMLICFQWIPG
jgi:hypothetical protein